jgi:hypothetical protein
MIVLAGALVAVLAVAGARHSGQRDGCGGASRKRARTLNQHQS